MAEVSVSRFSPFRDCSRHFVERPQHVRSADAVQGVETVCGFSMFCSSTPMSLHVLLWIWRLDILSSKCEGKSSKNAASEKEMHP